MILDKIRSMKKEDKSSFNVFSSKIVIGDPSNNGGYDFRHFYSTLNGKWVGYSQYFFNKYNADIFVISHSNYIDKDIRMVPGRGLIYTDVASFYIGDLYTIPKNQNQYEKIMDLSNKELKNGYMVNTGFDGSIKYYVGYSNGKVVKIIIYNLS